MTPCDKQLYRPQEAATYLGVGLSTIWNYIKRGDLTTIKQSPQVTVIPRADLEAFVEQMMERGETPTKINPALVWERIRWALEAAGKPSRFDKHVAEALGIPHYTIAQSKHCETLPWEEVALFAARHNLSLNWLLFGQPRRETRSIGQIMEGDAA